MSIGVDNILQIVNVIMESVEKLNCINKKATRRSSIYLNFHNESCQKYLQNTMQQQNSKL